MKKVLLVMMLAGSVSVFEACNVGNASKDAADSVKDINNYDVNNKDTSKTTTTSGGATLLDYSGSGGIKIVKGKPSSRTNMNSTIAAAPTPVAAADTAKKDTTVKK